ncbi:hypothetical protein Pan97_39550 [Bremerella volcania]|uniref:Uncharacterized protein n=1 Tax=Bremerella volcania TaxID=2527984 RepID=A0A518CCE9_9BACT|nr:hypothetical protein [Bremerella volcania]QDU76898.1 hypothetical protein Pan97_39550 [Bremerella volcania]
MRQTEQQDREARADKKHYWLREDFDQLMELLPNIDDEKMRSRNSSTALIYPKSTEGAFRELRLRGLYVDGIYLWQLAEKGIVQPKGARPGMTWTGNDWLEWSKEDIDAAAEWIYENDQDRWSSWTHYCWVNNLRFGQCVKARRVAAARYKMGFSTSFDVLGLVTVIEPSTDPNEYAYIRFFPQGTKLEPQEATNVHSD